jgi:HEAT repeat protein
MPIVKHEAAQSVGEDERQIPRDFVGLVAELASDNPVARRWAARDLSAFPEAGEALVARIHGEGNPSVRETILTTLTRLGDDVAVAGLVDCLRGEDPALRNQAVEAMQQLPEKVGAIMGGLLADADSDVRIFAVNILESLRHPQVEAWLIDVIERDAHVNVCATALDLLGEVGTERALDALGRLKARFPGEPYIQFASDLAIKRIGGG